MLLGHGVPRCPCYRGGIEHILGAGRWQSTDLRPARWLDFRLIGVRNRTLQEGHCSKSFDCFRKQETCLSTASRAKSTAKSGSSEKTNSHQRKTQYADHHLKA